MLLLHGLQLETVLAGPGERMERWVLNHGSVCSLCFLYEWYRSRGEATYFSDVVLVNPFGRLSCKPAWWMRFIHVGEMSLPPKK
jgi:hypothetical protein